MRALPAIAMMALALSGCAGETTDDPNQIPPPMWPVHRELPANFTGGGSVLVSLAAGNLPPAPAPNDICSPAPLAQCYRFNFMVNATPDPAPGTNLTGYVEPKDAVAMTATLTWGMAPNDFDMYVYQGATLISSDGINSLGSTNPADYTATQQVLHAELPPGEYDIVVAGWFVVLDNFDLAVTFEEP